MVDLFRDLGFDPDSDEVHQARLDATAEGERLRRLLQDPLTRRYRLAGSYGVKERIVAAIEDYSRIFPPPYSLAPNLQLASAALADYQALQDEKDELLAEVGLPPMATLRELIDHHRANAALSGAMEAMAAGYRSGNIPEDDQATS